MKWYCEGEGCNKTTPAINLKDLWPTVGWGCLRVGPGDTGYLSLLCGSCLAECNATYDDETGEFEL